MEEGRGCIATPQGDQIAGSRPRAGRWADRWGHRWAARKSVPIKSPIPGFQPFPGVSQGFHSCPVVRYLPKSRVAHNPKVAGSNPAPATNLLLYKELPRTLQPSEFVAFVAGAWSERQIATLPSSPARTWLIDRFRFGRGPGSISNLNAPEHAVAHGDQNCVLSLRYFLAKGRVSKKISLRAIRPSLNVISAAVRQTPMGSPKSIS